MKLQVFEREDDNFVENFNEWMDLHKKNIEVKKLNYGYSRQGYLMTIVVQYEFRDEYGYHA